MKYFGGPLKDLTFRGGEGSRKINIEGRLPKKGGTWTVCRFKGGLGKKEKVVFLRGWGLIPQCTLCE